MNNAKRALKYLVRIATFPARYAVRVEYSNANSHANKDIQSALQRSALETTARYVEEKMSHVSSYSDKFKLFDAILKDTAKVGLWLEFGVYRGETLNYIASYAPAVIYGFDSFEGLPEFWRDGFDKGAFGINEMPEASQKARLVKGWFDDTLPEFIANHSGEEISFIHVDCDLYSSTKTIFNLCEDKIKPGTIIVFDEYFNYPGWQNGEYKAFQEFMVNSDFRYEYIGYVWTHEQVAVRILAKEC